jgi:hypothetical protein
VYIVDITTLGNATSKFPLIYVQMIPFNLH